VKPCREIQDILDKEWVERDWRELPYANMDSLNPTEDIWSMAPPKEKSSAEQIVDLIMDRNKITQEEIASRVGVSRQYVAKIINKVRLSVVTSK
jgi:AraC-like DNA-binding protein